MDCGQLRQNRDSVTTWSQTFLRPVCFSQSHDIRREKAVKDVQGQRSVRGDSGFLYLVKPREMCE